MKKEDIPSLRKSLKHGWKAVFLPIIVFLPFLLTSQFEDFFKSRLVITLNQATPMASIETKDGGYYLISENGRILDSTLTAPDPSYITVTGFNPEYAVSGAFLSVADEGTRNYLTKFLKSVKMYGNLYVESDIGAGRKIDILYDVIDAYKSVGIEEQIKAIDITSIYSIRLNYDDRFIFDLGDDTDMEVKLTIAKNLIAKGEFDNEKGELDLSKAADPELGMKVTFRPTYQPGDIPSDDEITPDTSKPEDTSEPEDTSAPDDTSEPDDMAPGDTTPPEE
jgi:cell division protein FtsQ